MECHHHSQTNKLNDLLQMKVQKDAHKYSYSVGAGDHHWSGAADFPRRNKAAEIRRRNKAAEIRRRSKAAELARPADHPT